MGNAAKRDKRTAETQEKRHQALELRKRGLTYRQISQALSCSISVAHEYVESAIAAIPREAAEDVRRLELERVDRMIAGAWPKAAAGDTKAILAVCKLMERRAKYLGLDAPTQISHDVRKLTNEQLEQLAMGQWPTAAPNEGSGGVGTSSTSGQPGAEDDPLDLN